LILKRASASRSSGQWITPFLDGQQFDTETKRIVGIAFEMARIALGLTERTDPILMRSSPNVELAKAGERNPDILCEGVVENFRDRVQVSG